MKKNGCAKLLWARLQAFVRHGVYCVAWFAGPSLQAIPDFTFTATEFS